MPKLQSRAGQLPENIQKLLLEIIDKAKPDSIVLFGSRARGDHRENSDFDLSVIGRSCSEDEWNRLLIDIKEGPWTLFSVDVVEQEKLDKAYLQNIKRDGVLLYG